MPSYQRLGSFVLADRLATVPSGQIHRALTTVGSAFERHYLLWSFNDEVREGVGSRWAEAQQAAALCDGTRGFGANYRLEPDRPAHLACEYAPGRTLAQVLDRIREEQVPFGIDHALTIMQSVAQTVQALHGKGLRHGTLSPHSVWVSYEGATQVLDAPFAAILQALLPQAPVLKAALAPYQGPEATAFQQDLFALGALLYEMLTLEKLPTGAAIAEALAHGTLRASQEEGGLPEEILALLKRLLMVDQPFATATEFNGMLERVLYDGDYSPTTFNVAFLMHTLFREANEADAQAVKAEQGAGFTPIPVPDAGVPGSHKPARGGNRTTLYLIAGGVVVAALFGAMYSKIQQDNRQHQLEQRSLQARLEAFQQEKEANDRKLADLAKQEEAQKTLEELFGKQAETAATAEARASAKRDLESAQQKTRDLARQHADALKEKQKLALAAPRSLPQAPPPAPAPAAPVAPAATVAADSGPVVTQMATVQAPRAGTRESLPASLQNADIKVSLKVFVDASGRPQKVVVLKGIEGNSGYNEAAQSAALASSFAPGVKGGKPTAGWTNLEFEFGKPR
jgi:hypothetical protein